METILMNTENSKMNEPHKFVLNLSHRLDLISSNNAISKAVQLKSRANGLGGLIISNKTFHGNHNLQYK